jgi:hypothetical protein
MTLSNKALCDAFFQHSPLNRELRSNSMTLRERHNEDGSLHRSIYSYGRLLATGNRFANIWIFRGIFPGRSSRTTNRHITELCRAATRAKVDFSPIE